MTWAIVIMVGVFVILRALQGANRNATGDALERATAAALDPLQSDADDPEVDADPSFARTSEPRAAPQSSAEPAQPLTTTTDPRTRAIIRSIHGKGLCSPRGD